MSYEEEERCQESASANECKGCSWCVCVCVCVTHALTNTHAHTHNTHACIYTSCIRAHDPYDTHTHTLVRAHTNTHKPNTHMYRFIYITYA